MVHIASAVFTVLLVAGLGLWKRTHTAPEALTRIAVCLDPSFSALNSATILLAPALPSTLTTERRPLAGTRRRGKTPEQDQQLEEELLADEKECAEHVMLVDLGRNDVGKVCALKACAGLGWDLLRV
jgi:hypothetical protein